MKMQTIPLSAEHSREAFDCGNEQLNGYLKRQASQDMKRDLALCFVLTNPNHQVMGYYTLSNYAVSREYLPENLSRKLPPAYKKLPATLLGRLAVDQTCKGRGLGAFLLIDALKRAYEVARGQMGSLAVFVDPIDASAKEFYAHYKFIELPGSGKLFLPMKTIGQLF